MVMTVAYIMFLIAFLAYHVWSEERHYKAWKAHLTALLPPIPTKLESVS